MVNVVIFLYQPCVASTRGLLLGNAELALHTATGHCDLNPNAVAEL